MFIIYFLDFKFSLVIRLFDLGFGFTTLIVIRLGHGQLLNNLFIKLFSLSLSRTHHGCLFPFLLNLKLLSLAFSCPVCLLPVLCHQDSFTSLLYTGFLFQPIIGPCLPFIFLIPISSCNVLPPILIKASFSLSKCNLKLLYKAPPRGSRKDRWGFGLSLVHATWNVFISSHVILQYFCVDFLCSFRQ